MIFVGYLLQHTAHKYKATQLHDNIVMNRARLTKESDMSGTWSSQEHTWSSQGHGQVRYMVMVSQGNVESGTC